MFRRISSDARDSRLSGIVLPIRLSVVRRVGRKQGLGVCYRCDTTGANRVNHLIALADGGTNDLTNLASCHPDCTSANTTIPSGPVKGCVGRKPF
jgi:5-methylcytosine-specific restriction endonuclease McrA